jgi:hypothetical protein
MGSKKSARPPPRTLAVKPSLETGEVRFSITRGFVIIAGTVGGLVFVPPSVVWPLDLLRGAPVTDGAEVLTVVTAIGWTGLTLLVRAIVRPRLVFSGGELRENRFLASRTMLLSAVTSVDRVRGRVNAVKPRRVDELYLFRGHPEKPWVIDLGLVEEPNQFMNALRVRCRVTYGSYTPQNAPPWARG